MTIAALVVVAFLLSYGIDRFYCKLWSKNLDAIVSFQKEPAMEGQEAILTETITNNKWLFLPVLQVGFQTHRNLVFSEDENTSVSDLCYKRDIFSVGGYEKITRTISFQCTKRGFYGLDKMELITKSILLVREFYATLHHTDTLYVYPRLVDDKLLDPVFQKVVGMVQVRKRLLEDPFAFRGIREYQPTDPMNRINWKASARADGWMVNQFDSSVSQEVVVLLDVEDESIWKYDVLHEEGIRIAASLTLRCMEQGIPVRVICNGRDCISKELVSIPGGFGKQQARRLNEGLARIDLSEKPESMEVLLREEREHYDGGQYTYVMISKNQMEKTRLEFEAVLKQGGGGVWISTLHHDMECILPSDGIFTLIRWEVEK